MLMREILEDTSPITRTRNSVSQPSGRPTAAPKTTVATVAAQARSTGGMTPTDTMRDIMSRLNEAGPWDPTPPAGNVLQFPAGGKGGVAPTASQSSGVPKVSLPKIDPAKVKSFMKLRTVASLIGKVIKKAFPAAGAYYWGSNAYDMAKSGRWRDMFISLAGAGMNIASVFGYAAGGVGGAALTVAEIAAALYVERDWIIREYYHNYHPNLDISGYSDDVVLAYADELTKMMAQYIYEEIKAGAVDAYEYMKSYAQGPQKQQSQP